MIKFMKYKKISHDLVITTQRKVLNLMPDDLISMPEKSDELTNFLNENVLDSEALAKMYTLRRQIDSFLLQKAAQSKYLDIIFDYKYEEKIIKFLDAKIKEYNTLKALIVLSFNRKIEYIYEKLKDLVKDIPFDYGYLKMLIDKKAKEYGDFIHNSMTFDYIVCDVCVTDQETIEKVRKDMAFLVLSYVKTLCFQTLMPERRLEFGTSKERLIEKLDACSFIDDERIGIMKNIAIQPIDNKTIFKNLISYIDGRTT